MLVSLVWLSILMGTLISEWNMVKCGSMNEYLEKYYSTKIGLLAKNLSTIMDSINYI